jgi:hypothetical protein
MKREIWGMREKMMGIRTNKFTRIREESFRRVHITFSSSITNTISKPFETFLGNVLNDLVNFGDFQAMGEVPLC